MSISFILLLKKTDKNIENFLVICIMQLRKLFRKYYNCAILLCYK